jgi:hypothetical protein
MPNRFSKLSGAHLAGFGGLKNYATDPFRPNTVLHLATEGSLYGYSNRFSMRDNNNYARYRYALTSASAASAPLTTKFSPAGNAWSCYFNGSGDYLSLSDSANLEIGSSDFTIEAWIFPEIYQSTADGGRYYSTIISKLNSYYFHLEGTTSSFTTLGFSSFDGSTLLEANASYTFKLSNWYHVAVSRSGTQLYLFVNGQLLSTSTDSRTFQNNANGIQIAAMNATRTFSGHISNLRMVVGSSVYSSAFSPSKTPLTTITNTKLLTCASNRFRDLSSFNFTITAVGNAAVKASSPFLFDKETYLDYEGFSAVFDGAKYFETPAATSGNNLQLGTSDFTIEFWGKAKAPNTSPWVTVAGSANELGFYGWKFINKPKSGLPTTVYENLTFMIYLGNDNTRFVEITLPNFFNNSWTHVAVVRSGNDVYGYMNGVLVDSQTIPLAARNLNYISTITFGAEKTVSGSSFAQYFTGSLSNILIIKQALYHSNFTPSQLPKTPYPVSSSIPASLLICQSMYIRGDTVSDVASGTIEDNSPNNHTITWSTTQDQNTNNDGPAFQHNHTSWFFSGDGYLRVADNTTLELGSTQFTIEAWIYPVAYQTTLDSGGRYSSAICAKGSSYQFYISSSNSTSWETLNFSITTGVINVPIQANYSFQNEVWYHIAVSRDSSGVFRAFVNGNLIQETAVTSLSAADNGLSFSIGASIDTGYLRYFKGNISNLRIAKSAIYTSSFPVPTKPLSLLGDTYSVSGNRTVSILTCFGKTFTDYSMVGHTFILFGTNQPQISVSSPFRKEENFGSSYYFNGSSSTYLVADGTDTSFLNMAYQTTNFTVEFWFYALDISSTSRILFDNRSSAGTAVLLWINTTTSSTIQVTRGGTTPTLLGTSPTFQLRSWNHIAVSKVSNTIYGFLNGVQFFSGADFSTYATPGRVQLGAGLTPASNFFNGYISNVFICARGIGRYSSNFTPTFRRIPPINGPLFAPNQIPVLFDSTRKQTITMVGNSITKDEAPVGRWTTNHPLYLDGDNDYIDILNSSDFEFRDGDFTIETWVKISQNSTAGSLGNRYATLFSVKRTSDSFGWDFSIMGSASTTGTGLSLSSKSSLSETSTTQSFSISQSEWHHVAVTRQNGFVRFFFNGLLQGSAASYTSSLINETSALTWIGAQNVTASTPTNAQFLNGYLYDFRVTKGVARYIESFAIPKSKFPIR